MMTKPPELSPEALAWMQAQITIGTACAVAPVRDELGKLEDWSNGVFVVLLEVLPLLLRDQPELAATAEGLWGKAAQRFDRLQASGQRRTAEGESLELLEARKLLYRLFALVGVWPARGQVR